MNVAFDGDKLLALRRGKAMSQAQLAREVGVTLKTILRLEQGSGGNPTTVRKLADFFGIEPQELLVDSAEMDNVDEYRDYLAGVRNAFGRVQFVSFAPIGDEADMVLEHLFVEPELSLRYADANALPDKWPERRRLFDVLRETKHLVILGDPGSGKSTIVAMIACQLAEEGKSNPWRQALERRIPVPLILRELVLPDSYDFDDLVAGLAETRLGAEHLTRKDVQLAIDAVKQGRAIVFLDGIDEVGDEESRRTLHRAVWNGMRRHPDCRFVITSRLVGFDAVPFDLEKLMVHRDIKPMNVVDLKSPELVDFGLKLAMREDPSLSEFMRNLPAVGSNIPRWHVVPFDNPRIERFCLNWYRQREKTERQAQRTGRTWSRRSSAISPRWCWRTPLHARAGSDDPPQPGGSARRAIRVCTAKLPRHTWKKSTRTGG